MALAKRNALLIIVMLLGVLAASTCGTAAGKKNRAGSSSVCASIECPSYEVVYEADDFSIRLCNGTVWMSTFAIQDISFYNATQTGFLRLFAYIQGANEEGVTVDMTAPVLTGVIPSDGPFCETSFIVRFYVPTANQASPPTPISSLGLQVERWDTKYFAVRQFGGFATDTNVVEEGATLSASVYEAGFTVASTSSNEESYFVAQYNSPFEISGRVNEVLLPLSYSSLLLRKSP
eukprot:c20945_g1_i1 orf=107-808(+)